MLHDIFPQADCSHLKDAAKGAKILSIKNTLNLKVTLTHRTLTGLAVQG